MGFPEPPTDGKTSSWIGFVIICVALAVAYVGFNTLGGRVKARKGAQDDPSLNLPTPGDEPDAQISTKGMSPDMVTALSKVSGTLATVVAHNTDLDNRVQALEATQRHLVEHVVILRKGIANGTIPPLPELAENIKHLFGDLL